MDPMVAPATACVPRHRKALCALGEWPKGFIMGLNGRMNGLYILTLLIVGHD